MKVVGQVVEGRIEITRLIPPYLGTVPPPPPPRVRCKYCGIKIGYADNKCPHCGAPV